MEQSMRTIKVKGMSCQHCVKAVTKALEEIDGISGIKVDLLTGEVSFEESGSVDEKSIKEKIQAAGYELV
jgi:copper chaperone